MARKLAVIGAFSVTAACLFAQGLNTTASPNDWEEINFEFNSSILSDGYPSLLRLAELLKQHPDYRVKITGNTDSVGSQPYNQKLSTARANTVRDFLVKYGASAGQVSVEGRGKNDPKVGNNTKEGRFMNRRVTMTVTDGQGRVVSAGGVGEAIHSFDELLKKQEECCSQILKRLDKLDEILAAIRDLKGENDRLKGELADLRNAQNALQNQINAAPKPLTAEQTRTIAKEENLNTLEEATRRNKKFSLLGLNVGPTYGSGRTGDFTFSGRGQFFSPFGGSGTHAVQAQGEYMYYPGRQEGQFDIGLVNRWNQLQIGGFGSFKYLSFREYQNGGALAQGAVTVDYLFGRGRFGVFGTKGFKNTAVLNRTNLGPNSYLETYARIVNQVGASGLVGLAGNTYLEGNVGYLQSHGRADRPGGMLRFVAPLNNEFAFTVEAGLNETLMNAQNSGRVVFGIQLGNFIRPKEYLNTKSPVPVDVPRIRYELLTRRVGNSTPVADAGPDQVGVSPGTITLDGSGSYDPEGDALTYAWSQLSGPAVSISGMTTARATFTAAAGQSYSFRLTVKDTSGLQASARVTVTTTGASSAGLQIIRFSATPPSINPGESSTLSWATQGGSRVEISGIGEVPANGSRVVSPAQTTTYTLTVRAADGTQITAPVIVTVGPSQTGAMRILSFSSNPVTSQKAGDPVTLTWTTENATSVIITGNGVPSGPLPVNGSITVNPITNSSYTLTAYGPGGTSTSSVLTVFVR